MGWVLVAHAYNPSYLGGRDQEDLGSNPAWANSSETLSQKNPSQKKDWWSGLRYRCCVQTPVLQKKKREKYLWLFIPTRCLVASSILSPAGRNCLHKHDLSVSEALRNRFVLFFLF
jgi:hypothetical protein